MGRKVKGKEAECRGFYIFCRICASTVRIVVPKLTEQWRSMN